MADTAAQKLELGTNMIERLIDSLQQPELWIGTLIAFGIFYLAKYIINSMIRIYKNKRE